MKLSILSLVMLLTVRSTAYAQSDFRSGFIITYQNDTLPGLLDSRSERLNAKRCLFRTKAEKKPSKYTPDDIRAFRFADSKLYVARQLPQGKVFLECLVDGVVDVYFYRDNRGDHYLIQKPGEPLVELQQDIRYLTIGGEKYPREDKSYITTLEHHLREVPSLQPKIERANLSHTSLVDIAKAYHKRIGITDDPCIVYEKKYSTPKLLLPFTLLFGGTS